MKEIFIFAQTRSGSTLLQRAINQTPDVCIYGEHGGMLHGFADAYYATDFRESFNEPEKLKNPFVFAPCLSCIEQESFKNGMRIFLTGVLNPNNERRWGFKEVRYKGGRVFDLLSDLYPTAKFVFLVRDPDQGPFNDSAYYWLDTFMYFSKCRDAQPKRCKMIEYQQLGSVAELFEWLELDNRKTNLFRQMPRIGETKHKQHLTNGQLSCLEELGLHKPFFDFKWDL